MTPLKARLLLGAVFGLIGGVAANALFLQSDRHGTTTLRSIALGKPSPGARPESPPRSGDWVTRLKSPVTAPKPGSPEPAPRRMAAANPRPTGKLSPDSSKLPAAGPHILEPAGPRTVRAVQRELSARGYAPGESDGVIGLMTRAAIMAYQHDNGLPLTAEPSEELLRHIILGRSLSAPISLPSQGEQIHVDMVVRVVQRALASLGYYTARIDGRLNETTTRAIREFELDQKREPKQRISGQLIAALGRATGSPLTVPAGR
ncbi:MAG: peptidoglycan-binding protein [Hyphomicrobiaceae bacterium]|nr:peptidoglycan-binding protein [Hyphomicrobiaceae bacterium]